MFFKITVRVFLTLNSACSTTDEVSSQASGLSRPSAKSLYSKFTLLQITLHFKTGYEHFTCKDLSFHRAKEGVCSFFKQNVGQISVQGGGRITNVSIEAPGLDHVESLVSYCHSLF